VLDGEELSQTNEAERARVSSEKIGFVFQAFNLLPRLNVLENVMLPLSYRRIQHGRTREQALAALERVGLSDRIRHRPSQLSGGQRQRVAVARALVNEPRLVLADEPTGNLDSVTARHLLESLAELNRSGVTVLLVTHDRQVASYAKVSWHMLDGEVARRVPNSGAGEGPS
jgi:putative ABC transport system ATP-binding protein